MSAQLAASRSVSAAAATPASPVIRRSTHGADQRRAQNARAATAASRSGYARLGLLMLGLVRSTATALVRAQLSQLSMSRRGEIASGRESRRATDAGSGKALLMGRVATASPPSTANLMVRIASPGSSTTVSSPKGCLCATTATTLHAFDQITYTSAPPPITLGTRSPKAVDPDKETARLGCTTEDGRRAGHELPVGSSLQHLYGTGETAPAVNGFYPATIT